MSASGPVHDGPDELEFLEELFGTVFDLAGEIASRISQDQVEARLRRTLQETGHHQEEKPARKKEPDRKAAQEGQADKVPRNDPSVTGAGSGAALPGVSHAEVLDRMYGYLDGELDDHDCAVIRQHLDECGPCLREYGLEEAVKRIGQAQGRPLRQGEPDDARQTG